jgi:hypothetical protein
VEVERFYRSLRRRDESSPNIEEGISTGNEGRYLMKMLINMQMMANTMICLSEEAGGDSVVTLRGWLAIFGSVKQLCSD